MDSIPVMFTELGVAPVVMRNIGHVGMHWSRMLSRPLGLESLQNVD